MIRSAVGVAGHWCLLGIFTVVAMALTVGTVAGKYHSGASILEVRALLKKLANEVGRPVSGRLEVRERKLILELRYVPDDGVFVDPARCQGQLRWLVESAASNYTGYADIVSVVALSSERVVAVGDVPARREYSDFVEEIRRRFDRRGVLSSGDRRWPLAPAAVSHKWLYIVIHHSGADSGSAASFDRWHRVGKNWDSLGYHFVIGNGNGSRDGLVEVGERWPKQIEGAHAGDKEYNYNGIGICLVGNFSGPDDMLTLSGDVLSKSAGGYPTSWQMRSLKDLVLYLMLRYNVPASRVLRHGDIKNTVCPGSNFPMTQFKRELKRDIKRLGEASG
jgi:N-acetylmuramoyl-L-alanine amidase